jgi:hypothetical protein
MMAYSTSNPPVLISVAPLTGTGQVWAYRSTDAATAVDATGYITNAKALGMRAGDLVRVTNTATNITTMHHVMSITAAGAADLADGTTIGSATNAD